MKGKVPNFDLQPSAIAAIGGRQAVGPAIGGMTQGLLQSNEAQAQPQNQGGDTKQAAEHFIRMKRDPEYRKKVLEGGNQSGIE